MNTLFIEKVKSLLADPSNMNLESLKLFLEESVEYFKEMQNEINSSDPKVKEAALKKALDVKKGLEEQMSNLSNMMGMTPEEMVNFAADTSFPNEGESKIIEEAKEKLLKSFKQNKKSPAHAI